MMKKNVMFTVVAVMVLCASGFMAIVISDSDASDAATIDSKSGNGTESDPYVVYAYEGDSLNVHIGKDATLSSGNLPNKVSVKDEKLTGDLIGSARVSPYVAVVSVDSGLKYVEIHVLKPVQDSVSGNTLRGFGTPSDPWKLSVPEGNDVSFNFSFYGSSMEVSGDIPSGLTKDGSKLLGTLSDDSKGEHRITLTIDGNTYYMELTVSSVMSPTVTYVALVLVLIVFAAFVIMWSSKFGRSRKKE